MNARTALAAPALLLAAGVALTGCSAYESLVHKRTTSTFDDVSAFREAGEVEADWLPGDATEITLRTSTVDEAADAVILLTSASPLVGGCTEVERYSAPSWTLDGAPDPYDDETVFACGDWSVIETGTGWFGWTPNSDEERSAAAG